MSAKPDTFTARDARNSRQSYQHIAAVVNRLLNRIMQTMDGAEAKKYFRPTVFHTIHALHAFFHGQDLSKKDLIKSHQFVAPYFDYHGDPKNSSAFMGTRLDALKAAESACGREFVTLQRADNKTLLYTHYKAHPLLTAAEWVYLQARQKPDYWKCPAAAVTEDLLDAALARLPEAKPDERPEVEAPTCGHPAESGQCEECGERWESADIAAGQVLKGRWMKWEDKARDILVAEFDAGADPELVAEREAAKIIEMGRAIKQKLARERLRGFSAKTPDEIADSPSRKPGDVATEEILAEVEQTVRTTTAHNGKNSVGASGVGSEVEFEATPRDFSLGVDVEVSQNEGFAKMPCADEGGADTRLACALDYARQGLAVLALWGVADGVCDCWQGSECRTAGKHPHSQLARNGVYSATADMPTIRKWFAKDPRINIGVAMGGPLNLVCVDIDPRNDGDATYYDLIEAHGEDAFPETFTVRTGGNGWHKLYRLPEAVRPKTGELKGKLGPGVDLKGAGGQIVGVGSIHESGRTYEVETNTYIAEAPAWLVTAARKAADGSAPEVVIDFQAHRGQRASAGRARTFRAGERNNGLRDVCLGRWSHGYAANATELYRQMVEVRATRCEEVPGDPAMTDAELWNLVQRTVRNYARGELRDKEGAA